MGSQHGLAVRKVTEKEVIKQNLTFKLQNKRRPVIFGCAAGGSGVVAEGKKALNGVLNGIFSMHCPLNLDYNSAPNSSWLTP